MSHRELLENDGILIGRPSVSLAAEVDPYVAASGDLRGLLVEVESLSERADVSAFLSHLPFVRDLHRHIGKLAVVSGSAFGSVARGIADHFVAAEVRYFGVHERDAAMLWPRQARQRRGRNRAFTVFGPFIEETSGMPVSALIVLIALVVLTSFPAVAEKQPRPGTLEQVAELPINPGNLAVTVGGRVFATVHPFRRAEAQLIEVTGRTSYRPWPDASWNGSFGSGPDVLNSPLGIAIDRKERLWVLDNGRGEPPQTPKLLAFSLADGRLAFRYDFPPDTGPTNSFLNDLAVDDERGFVYMADVGGSHDPALVWLDLNTRSSRRFTASQSLRAEDVDLVVEGRVIEFEGADGTFRPARVAVNPITLSADGETLYFGAMNGETWYRLPARLLREGADDAQIAAAIERAGPKPVSDGASTDTEGNHFFTDLGNNAITMLRPDGQTETVVRDDRLLWPDALSFGEPGWLYIAVNQLHRAPPFNGGIEGAELPYRILRVFTGTRGIAGR